MVLAKCYLLLLVLSKMDALNSGDGPEGAFFPRERLFGRPVITEDLS
jgi:hypothetical protein